MDSKKGFTFAPLSAPKTGGEVLKKLRKKFFKNLVDSKKGFTFAPLSAPKISGKVSEKWFFELLVNLRKRDRKSTRLNSSHMPKSRMPSSA